MTRHDVQSATKAAVLKALSNTNSVSILNGTGTGKTLALLEIAGEIMPNSVLWVTNSEQLRDIDTPNEFIKWGFEWLLERTDIVCVQTACKWEKDSRYYDLIIVDEADFTLTDVYSTIYSNIGYKNRILASASIREDQKELLIRVAPVAYTFSTQDAQDAGIINKTKFVFVGYDLEQTKTYKRIIGKKSWYTSEQETMDYIEKSYVQTLIEYQSVSKELREKRYNLFVSDDIKKALEHNKSVLARKLSWINKDRYQFLMTLNSSKRIAKSLINTILNEDKDNKIIVFSAFTDSSDKICEHTYHSKNKTDNKTLDLLNKGDIRVAGACSAINRGKNLNGVNNAIFESYDGSHVKGQQRVGRMCRLLVGDNSIIYILVPYYKKRVKVKAEDGNITVAVKRVPTRALGWANSMLSDFRLDNNNCSTINL